MSTSTSGGFFSNLFRGSKPKPSTGDAILKAEVLDKIKEKTPDEPVLDGAKKAVTGRVEAVERAATGDLPSGESIKRGVESVRTTARYVSTGGPSHAKEDVPSVLKDEMIEAVKNVDVTKVVKAAKTTAKTTAVVTTASPEVMQQVQDDTVNMVRQTTKQVATTVGVGVGVGVGLKLMRRTPLPPPVKGGLFVLATAWTLTGLLATAYTLNDLGERTRDPQYGFFRKVMEKHNERQDPNKV